MFVVPQRLKSVILVLVVLVLGMVYVRGTRVGSRSSGGNEQSSRPIKNIVLINVDSLRADHMGAYGYTKNTTPFLDSLFARGVVFENAIAPAYLTFQTDAAIFSGLYPSQNNVTTWSTPINGQLPLIPGILKLYGYSTAAFVSPSMYDYFGWSKQFDSYNLRPVMKNIATTKTTVADWMTNTRGPFFVFWHIYDVHLPFIPPTAEFYPQFNTKEYRGPFNDGNLLAKSEKQTPDMWYFWDLTKGPPYQAPLVSRTLTQDDVDYLKASYDTGIRSVDDQLRLFFDSIKDKPFYKDTLFIISSEHGDDLKEHGYIFHRDLYDVDVKVPLAFIGPMLAPSRIKEAVSTIDIMDTVLPMVGVPAPGNSEGKDDRYLFGGNVSTPERSIFTERPPFDEYSVRRGNWKYILRNPDKKSLDVSDNGNDFFTDLMSSEGNFGDELYDLSSDPTEQVNLVGKGYSVESELKTEVLAFRDKMRQARNQNKSVNPVDKTLLQPYP